MKKAGLLFSLMFLMLAVFFYFGSPVSYSGKLVTESEDTVLYQSFKQAIAAPNVEIVKLEVLSSNPVVIQYSAQVPHGYTFPFGNSMDATTGPVTAGICVAVAVAFVVIGLKS